MIGKRRYRAPLHRRDDQILQRQASIGRHQNRSGEIRESYLLLAGCIEVRGIKPCFKSRLQLWLFEIDRRIPGSIPVPSFGNRSLSEYPLIG